MAYCARIISEQTPLADKVARSIQPAFAKIEICNPSVLLETLSDDVVCIVDVASITDTNIKSLRESARHNHVILISEQDVERVIALMVEIPEVDHIFGSFGDKNAPQLLTIVRHMLGTAPASVSSYVTKGTNLQTKVLQKYSEAANVIQSIRSLANDTGAFSELANIVSTVASEMIMNACFDAPISNGKPKYAHLPRTQDIILGEKEKVTVKFGFDRENFLVSVTDNFGALDRKTIVDNLERCAKRGADQIRHQSGGAGVGLYMLFRYSSQLDFHVIPGHRTEVVALVSLGKRLREYEMSGPCINFFVRDEQ